MVTKKGVATIQIILGIIIVALIGGEIYIGYTLQKENKELQKTIEKTEAKIEADLELTKENINTIQDQQEKKIDIISSAIEKIDKESKSKLADLQEQVKNVNIKSGDFSAMLQDIFPGIVSVATDIGRGSGAIITKDGNVVTNYHVIEGAQVIQVVDYKKHMYPAELIGVNKDIDLAVLKINGTFQRLNFADSDKVKVGERVVAVGNPAGLSLTVTEGIVSQIGRVISQKSPPMIQTDVPINPGNSGGPLININGNIIGINRLKIAGYESLGFAIPSNVVKTTVEEILQKDI